MIEDPPVQDAVVAGVRATYEDGQYATAYRRARAHGLLRVGPDTDPDVALLAANLIHHAGGARRARRIRLDVWRRHRRHPEACLRRAIEAADGGPLAVLEVMDRIEAAGAPGGTAEQRSDWWALRALELAELRDVPRARDAWDAACGHHVGAWTWCARAHLEAARDRTDEALAAIGEARAIRPWYRPAIDLEARLLQRARRFDDARALLEEAATRIEAVTILLALQVRRREDGDLDGAVAAIETAIARSPELEWGLHDYLAATLANLHGLRGDHDLAVRIRRLCRDDDLRAYADKLAGAPGPRVLLPVPQVPQDHNTCAPATLTSLAELWGEPADHVEIAEAICHDGTPAGSERRWAIERGFVARELTVTWEAAVALIDAGLPFALSTMFTRNGHLQAVAGYDARRRSLLVRDPSALALVELDWDALAESQAAFGPRGLVFAPPRAAAPLDGPGALDLPDAALYDRHFAIEEALRGHDRRAAQVAFEALAAAAPDHRLTHAARRALAAYDGDEDGVIAWTDALLARHPDDVRLLLGRFAWLDGHAGRAEVAALAERLLELAGDDPGVLAACADFLARDGAAGARAERLARRAIERGPHLGDGYRVLADLAWGRGERARATALHRIVSCLHEGDERAAWSYFAAAYTTGRVDDALAHLRDRFERMGGRSAQPARTLCEAYAAVGRTDEVFAILDRALATHPEDGDLHLVASEQHRLAGERARAKELLAAARGRCHDAAWRRSAAELATIDGRLDDAFGSWRELAVDQPLDLVSQRAYVEHLVRRGEEPAARAHLRALCARFPYHLPLAQLCDEHLAVHAEDDVRAHLEGYVARQPAIGWGLRRLAEVAAVAGDLAGARALLERARACEHDPAALAAAEASLARREGRREAARERWRAVIARDVDRPGAVAAYLELAGDPAEARRALDEVEAELDRQGSQGRGLLAFADGVRAWLAAEPALERIRRLRARRDHLWPAWAAEIDTLAHAGRVEAAADLAARAVERFAQHPWAWRLLGTIHARRGDHAARVAALARAHALAPAWDEGARLLGQAYLATGDLVRARALIERAIALDPGLCTNHGYLAEVWHDLGDVAAARVQVRRALELDPEYGWAWGRLVAWSDDTAEVVAFARALLARRPRAIEPRLQLAELDAERTFDERVALIDGAIAAAPHDADLADRKAVLLADAARWDDALAACRPPFWGDAPPQTLRGRAAWIRHRRGDGYAAIVDMIEAIAAAPGYEWGIDQLMEWADARGEYLLVAERLVRRVPDAALAHAHLGEAARLERLPERAEESFRRALELESDQRLARLGLFDVRYAAGRHDEAGPLLDGLPELDPWALARRIQHHAATGRHAHAEAALGRLLEHGGAGGLTPVLEAIAGFHGAGRLERARAIVEERLHRADAPMLVARAWWELVGSRLTRAAAWRRILRLPPGEASSWCATQVIEAFAERDDLPGLLWFLMWHPRELRARTDLWGSVGYVFSALGRRRMTRWWLGDYHRRAGVLPWMLFNLARSLLEDGRVARALGVCRDALRLPADVTTPRHRLLLAPGEACEDARHARELLARAPVRHDTHEDRFLAELARAVIGYRLDDGPEPARRARLEEALRDLVPREPDALGPVARVQYRHVIRELTTVAGGRRDWRWWWRLRWLHRR